MKLDEARRDLYRRLAREQGYKSRAAFKLKEANEKYHFLDSGDKVVDFGAAPGGWLQVASEIVGESGLAVGLDLQEIRVSKRNIHTVKLDVYDRSVAERVSVLLRGKADVVLSDLAPSVTGTWDLDHYRQVELTMRVLDLCEELLQRDGSAFFKVFDGERSQEVRREFGTRFGVVRAIKPHASRNQASELYYVCMGWRGKPRPREETARTASTTSS